MDVFRIQLGEPDTSENFLPPEDPLGELTPLEIGLVRFCFEQNRRVAVHVGPHTSDVGLFPDMCSLLAHLPEKLSRLARGEKTQLEFPESMINIKLSGEEGSTACDVRTFGRNPRTERYQCDRSQIIGALENVLNEIVRLAVRGGYVDARDAASLIRSLPAR